MFCAVGAAAINENTNNSYLHPTTGIPRIALLEYTLSGARGQGSAQIFWLQIVVVSAHEQLFDADTLRLGATATFLL